MSGFAKSQALTVLVTLLDKAEHERQKLSFDLKVADAGERQHHAAAVEAVGRLREVRRIVNRLHEQDYMTTDHLAEIDDAIGPESAE